MHVPIAVLTLALASGSVRESFDPQRKKLDGAGIATLSLSVFALTYFITQGPDLGFSSPGALGILGVAVVGFVVFVAVERTSPHPMFDFSVFRVRRFSGALLGSVGMNLSFWPFMIYLPVYFQGALGYDGTATGLSLLAYTLPTLVFPPLGERLTLRYRADRVIPAGLFAIGLGFILMYCGSGMRNAGWMTMLPGLLLAGIGLGVINTPVTNTTTGSVPAERSGMASGIDMSARMITLAINIALMGYLLVEGVLSYLQTAVPAMDDPAPLRFLAGKIAAGSFSSLAQDFPDVSATTVQAALVHGFGVVMLYGGVGVCLLAVFSFMIFGSGNWKTRPLPARTLF